MMIFCLLLLLFSATTSSVTGMDREAKTRVLIADLKAASKKLNPAGVYEAATKIRKQRHDEYWLPELLWSQFMATRPQAFQPIEDEVALDVLKEAAKYNSEEYAQMVIPVLMALTPLGKRMNSRQDLNSLILDHQGWVLQNKKLLEACERDLGIEFDFIKLTKVATYTGDIESLKYLANKNRIDEDFVRRPIPIEIRKK